MPASRWRYKHAPRDAGVTSLEPFPRCELLNQIRVGSYKVVLRKLSRIHPCEIRNIHNASSARNKFADIKEEKYSAIRVTMKNHICNSLNLNYDIEFLFDFTNQSIARVFIFFHFAARKFPL